MNLSEIIADPNKKQKQKIKIIIKNSAPKFWGQYNE